MTHRIRNAWEDYLKKVMPREASVVQIWETRRAFYAGALAILEIIHPEELDRELKEFLRDMKAGRA